MEIFLSSREESIAQSFYRNHTEKFTLADARPDIQRALKQILGKAFSSSEIMYDWLNANIPDWRTSCKSHEISAPIRI
jgi:hypothetical protein